MFSDPGLVFQAAQVVFRLQAKLPDRLGGTSDEVFDVFGFGFLKEEEEEDLSVNPFAIGSDEEMTSVGKMDPI